MVNAASDSDDLRRLLRGLADTLPVMQAATEFNFVPTVEGCLSAVRELVDENTRLHARLAAEDPPAGDRVNPAQAQR